MFKFMAGFFILALLNATNLLADHLEPPEPQPYIVNGENMGEPPEPPEPDVHEMRINEPIEPAEPSPETSLNYGINNDTKEVTDKSNFREYNKDDNGSVNDNNSSVKTDKSFKKVKIK